MLAGPADLLPFSNSVCRCPMFYVNGVACLTNLETEGGTLLSINEGDRDIQRITNIVEYLSLRLLSSTSPKLQLPRHSSYAIPTHFLTHLTVLRHISYCIPN
jgi:hypothetical protein